MYLIIYEICILMSPYVGYFLRMLGYLLLYVVAWISIYACDFHASNIVEQSFVFKIHSEYRVLGLQCAPPINGWVCCNLSKHV
jgi:hypothetical protein